MFAKSTDIIVPAAIKTNMGLSFHMLDRSAENFYEDFRFLNQHGAFDLSTSSSGAVTREYDAKTPEKSPIEAIVQELNSTKPKTSDDFPAYVCLCSGDVIRWAPVNKCGNVQFSQNEQYPAVDLDDIGEKQDFKVFFSPNAAVQFMVDRVLEKIESTRLLINKQEAVNSEDEKKGRQIIDTILATQKAELNQDKSEEK